MGFVNLVNAKGEQIRIPKNAVKSYENLGFFREDQVNDEAVEETNVEAMEDVNSQEDEQDSEEGTESEAGSEDEVFVNAIQKKPLASWNKEEVKRYASIFDIDLTGTKSANEAKERIKAFMNNAE